MIALSLRIKLPEVYIGDSNNNKNNNTEMSNTESNLILSYLQMMG